MGAPQGPGWRGMSRQMARGLGGSGALEVSGKLEGAGRVGGVVRTGGRTLGLRGPALGLGERLKWRGGRGHWNRGGGGERPEGCRTSPWAWQAQDGGRAWGGDEGSEHGCPGNRQTAAGRGARNRASPRQVPAPVVYKTVFTKLFFSFPVP